MSANYFNLGGGADHSSCTGSSLNRCQELLTIDGDSPWEVFQVGGMGGEVTETQCLWTANNNGRQLGKRQTKLLPNIALIRYVQLQLGKSDCGLFIHSIIMLQLLLFC